MTSFRRVTVLGIAKSRRSVRGVPGLVADHHIADGMHDHECGIAPAELDDEFAWSASDRVRRSSVCVLRRNPLCPLRGLQGAFAVPAGSSSHQTRHALKR